MRSGLPGAERVDPMSMVQNRKRQALWNDNNHWVVASGSCCTATVHAELRLTLVSRCMGIYATSRIETLCRDIFFPFRDGCRVRIDGM